MQSSTTTSASLVSRHSRCVCVFVCVCVCLCVSLCVCVHVFVCEGAKLACCCHSTFVTSTHSYTCTCAGFGALVQYDMALGCFERALSLADDDAMSDIWYNVAFVGMSLGNVKLARQVLAQMDQSLNISLHSLLRPLTHMHTYSHAHLFSHTLTLSHTHTHSFIPSPTYSHTHTHTLPQQTRLHVLACTRRSCCL